MSGEGLKASVNRIRSNNNFESIREEYSAECSSNSLRGTSPSPNNKISPDKNLKKMGPIFTFPSSEFNAGTPLEEIKNEDLETKRKGVHT